MADNETIADIIVEMRKTKYGDDECQVKWCLTPWADRLEAAHRREIDELKKQVGDAAKLREALAKVIEIAEREWDAFRETPAMWEIHEICKAALAEPPRNCDRHSGDYKMLHTEWSEWTASPSGRNPNNTMKMTFSEWLLAPATEEEGGAK